MNTFQTLCSLVALILMLSVVVQALNELVKAILGTKAKLELQAAPARLAATSAKTSGEVFGITVFILYCYQLWDAVVRP
jgi:hypothetical protein